MNVRSDKWIHRYIEMAKMISSWSKDTSTKVGCVIVDPKGSPVSWGYNGNAMGVEDTFERLERPVKYHYVAHAEKNAMDLCRSSLENCIMYITHAPCSSCAISIIQSGIKHVIIDGNNGFTGPNSYLHTNDKWKEAVSHSLIMFHEAGVSYTEYRKERHQGEHNE